MYVVLRRFDGIAAALALVAVGGVILKKTWYDRLDAEPLAGDPAREPRPQPRRVEGHA
jgi:hypothetical protein